MRIKATDNLAPLCILLVCLTCSMSSVSGRVFTNLKGKRINADFVSGTDTHVTLKLTKNRKTYTIPLAQLIQEDQDYIADKIETQKEEDLAKDQSHKIAAAIEKMVTFVRSSKGKKIGDGECWTLANEAYKTAGLSRPGADHRVWGRVVEWGKEELKAGDIVEFESAVFGDMRSGPVHTAIIVKPGTRKGSMEVYHQNWGTDKNVTSCEFNLRKLIRGKVIIYRYGK